MKATRGEDHEAGFSKQMPVQDKTTYQFFWKECSISREFKAGVSLHSHTMYSEESLDVLPRYVGRIPVVKSVLAEGVAYERAFWTPPLSPRQAHRLEEKQIQRQFQLPGLVSLTDHDSIQAGMLLRVLERFREAAISTEWTVPFEGTFFHIGLHNLPAQDARGIMEELHSFTQGRTIRSLGELLAMLNSYRHVLIVLNHPLWDEKSIGTANHAGALETLLRRHGGQLHALEVNGLRPWSENCEVIRLGRQTGMPVVSGGDRHGREPNAILNLSRAASLPEFIGEIRYARCSHVVFMPQYAEPLTARTIQVVIDILREYPEVYCGRRTWTERIFYRRPGSADAVPLTTVFPNGKAPAIFKAVTLAVKVAQQRGVQSVLRRAFADRASVWGDGEALL